MNLDTVIYCVHDSLWVGVDVRDGRGTLVLIDLAASVTRLFEFANPIAAVLELARLRTCGGGEPQGWFGSSVAALEEDQELRVRGMVARQEGASHESAA